jgi:hypothetical protein
MTADAEHVHLEGDHGEHVVHGLHLDIRYERQRRFALGTHTHVCRTFVTPL